MKRKEIVPELLALRLRVLRLQLRVRDLEDEQARHRRWHASKNFLVDGSPPPKEPVEVEELARKEASDAEA